MGADAHHWKLCARVEHVHRSVRYLYGTLNLGDVHFYHPYGSCVERHAVAQKNMALTAYCQITTLKDSQ
jgi:hypothetical protein